MKKSAIYTYSIFKKKDGSEHIASLNCLSGIIKYVNNRKSENILELGIGIGTIPFALKEAKRMKEIKHDFVYYGTEANQFCIDEFKKNIPGYEDFINHFPSLSNIPEDIMFDFIIVDGRDGSFDEILQRLKFGGVIIVEGGRRKQLSEIDRCAGKRKYLKSSEIALTTGHLGGYSVFFFDPSFLDYLLYMKNRIRTFVVYRINNFLKFFVSD